MTETSSTETSTTEKLARRIADALEHRLGAVEVADLVRLTGGASRETWSVDATDGSGALHRLVLRRDPPGRPSPPGTTSLEADSMRAAGRAGLPVPEILFSSDDPGPLGTAGMVMARVDGEALPSRLLRDPAYGSSRRVLTAQCGHALGALHSVDPDTIEGLAEDDPLAQLRERIDDHIAGGTADPVPTFEYALRWLHDNRPASSGRAIVHGDFRMGNLMVDESGLAAVLDWELVHIGDPIEDLGWLCVRAWRFGSPLPVGGVGTRQELVEAYTAANGVSVDGSTLHWWEVLATLRWGVICQTQAAVHLRGELPSVELAAIGRRVCETEWDLLLLLAPTEAVTRWEACAGAAAGPDTATRAGDLHGRPSAAELVDAVRGFLTNEVVAATSGSTSFQARVAAHTLRMVQRELELGDAQRATRASSLAALGFADEVGFALALRDGDLATGSLDHGVLGTLLDGVIARLLVASPRYAAPH